MWQYLGNPFPYPKWRSKMELAKKCCHPLECLVTPAQNKMSKVLQKCLSNKSSVEGTFLSELFPCCSLWKEQKVDESLSKFCDFSCLSCCSSFISIISFSHSLPVIECKNFYQPLECLINPAKKKLFKVLQKYLSNKSSVEGTFLSERFPCCSSCK